MGERVIIGGYVIDGIEMLDNATCCLYFEDFNEGDELISIVVEKWLDEDSWHFMDNRFALNGYFIHSDETTHLSNSEKEQVKEFMNSWLEDLGK